MPQVIHVTTSHNRDDQRIYKKECLSLAKAGFDTRLLVFDGRGDAAHGGIEIVDIGRGRAGRLGRFLMRPIIASAHLLRSHASAYHFHDPELLPLAALLKLLGRRVIFDLHEDYGYQIATRSGLPWLLRKLFTIAWPALERALLPRFDALIVPQEEMREKFMPLNRATYLVPNFVELQDDRIDPRPRRTGKRLVYVGALSEARGFSNISNLMLHSDSDWELWVAGPVEPPDLIEKWDDHPARERIHYLGVVSPAEVENILRQASVGLILYNNIGQYAAYSWATKAFEYMRFSLPIVMPDFPAWVAFNRKTSCGVCVNPADHLEVSSAVRALLADDALAEQLGNNGRAAVLQHYHWGLAESELLKAYAAVIPPAPIARNAPLR